MTAEYTVLIVDASETDARECADSLEERGHRTTVVREAPDPSGISSAIDCVVTETRLPNGDGLEFATDLPSRLPVVVYTKYGSEAVASRAITVGVDEYVPKSDGPDPLCAAVDRILESAPTVVDDEPDEIERYRMLVESVTDMIYALDAEGRITLANHAFAFYFGSKPDEIIGVHARTLLPEPAYQTGLELIHALLRTDETNRGRYEFEIERPNGTPRYLENNVSLVYDEDGEFNGSTGIIRDITRRKERKRELERQNERLEEFTSIVSHDLRNPLNVINGKVDLIRATEDLSHLDDIEDCTDHMEALLTDLLTLAREGRDVSETEPVSLERVAIDAWQHVDTGSATLSFESDLGTVEADRDRLEQLFENLFRNAVEHGTVTRCTPTSDVGDESDERADDGSDTTTTRTTSPPIVCTRDHDSDLRISIERLEDGFAIADTGPGIDPADADRIFERGYTTEESGTGFGLSIVERIAEAHGWSISLDPDHDGARFVIRT